MNLFWQLRSGLPREGPGSDESTRKALQSAAASLPDAPRIPDIGCGPGMQTLVLARETGGHVTAVDRHQPFLDELNRRGARDGLTAHFVLPEAAWWDHYYAPLERRIDALKREYTDNQEATAFLDGERKEISLYRKYSQSYGYVFYVARNTP